MPSYKRDSSSCTFMTDCARERNQWDEKKLTWWSWTKMNLDSFVCTTTNLNGWARYFRLSIWNQFLKSIYSTMMADGRRRFYYEKLEDNTAWTLSVGLGFCLFRFTAIGMAKLEIELKTWTRMLFDNLFKRLVYWPVVRSHPQVSLRLLISSNSK